MKEIEFLEDYGFGLGLRFSVENLQGKGKRIKQVGAEMGDAFTAEEFQFQPLCSAKPSLRGEVTVSVIAGLTYVEHVFDEMTYMESHEASDYRMLKTIERAVFLEQARIAEQEALCYEEG